MNSPYSRPGIAAALDATPRCETVATVLKRQALHLSLPEEPSGGAVAFLVPRALTLLGNRFDTIALGTRRIGCR